MKTIKSVKEEIACLEAQNEDLKNYRENIDGYSELVHKLWELRNEYQNSVSPKISQNNQWIRDYKKELIELQKERGIKISPEIEKWFYKWQSGVNFGYNDPKIVWISDDEKFVIITNKGGTAGQGTAMGTGGYYYSNTEHFLASTQHGSYLDNNHSMFKIKGRLTKENKQKLIEYIPKFIIQLTEPKWWETQNNK